MRTKISSSMLRRLEALEQKQEKSRVVMMVPKIPPVDEWYAPIVPAQSILKENVIQASAPDYGDLPKLELITHR